VVGSRHEWLVPNDGEFKGAPDRYKYADAAVFPCTPDDTLDKIDLRNLGQNVAAYAALAWLAAELDVEFRPGTAD